MPVESVVNELASELIDLYQETFESVQGMYLDKGTSLFETLNTISAQEASQPVSARCATIAAQVEHIRFYLDVLEKALRNEAVGKVDWGAVWRNTQAVSPEEWLVAQQRLRETYERILARIKSFDTWDGEYDISASLSIVVHTAYHLGEIRQALCTIKSTD